jgi:hypothetical protein
MNRPSAVHPHFPRFAQAITALLCLEALAFDTWTVVPVALALVLLNLALPAASPVAWLFRLLARPPSTMEPAAPVRFSQWIAATLLAAAVVLFALGVETAAWVLAGLVGGVALISAVTGFCIGCEVYRLLLLRRRAVDDLRRELGLPGDGPWLVVLTAPGCARCEPVARELERAAGGRQVVRVNIAQNPRAAGLPVRSVPAALAVGRGGDLRVVRAGRLGDEDLKAVLAAV